MPRFGMSLNPQTQFVTDQVTPAMPGGAGAVVVQPALTVTRSPLSTSPERVNIGPAPSREAVIALPPAITVAASAPMTPSIFKSPSFTTENEVPRATRPSATAAVIAPAPAGIPEWLAPPTMAPPGRPPSRLPRRPPPGRATAFEPGVSPGEFHAFKNAVEGLFEQNAQQHKRFADAIADALRSARDAAGNVGTLAKNAQTALNDVNSRMLRIEEAILQLTRGVVETYTPRRQTRPGTPFERDRKIFSRGKVKTVPGTATSIRPKTTEGTPKVSSAMDELRALGGDEGGGFGDDDE